MRAVLEALGVGLRDHADLLTLVYVTPAYVRITLTGRAA